MAPSVGSFIVGVVIVLLILMAVGVLVPMTPLTVGLLCAFGFLGCKFVA